jgi:hypothetical protein
MKYLILICFTLVSCAATITPYYISVYAESKPELNVIVKDLEKNKIKYKIVEYPNQHIYEIMYEEPVEPKE